MQIDENKLILGALCYRGHEHENTGKSLRYIKSGNCVVCEKTHKRKKYKPINKTAKREARVFASIHCPDYSKCMNEAAYVKDGKGKMQCHKCDTIKDRIKTEYFKNEIGTDNINLNYNEMIGHTAHLPYNQTILI